MFPLFTRMEFGAFGPNFVVSNVDLMGLTSSCICGYRSSQQLSLLGIYRRNPKRFVKFPILRVIEYVYDMENRNPKSNGE